MDGPGWRVGSRFGPYELRSLLGRGGMGEVYEAYDTVKDRVVAVKLLPEQFAKDPVYQVRFRRESQAAARLAEPHIIPIHDWGVIEGVLFIDMRLVPGVDLRTILRTQGPLSPDRSMGIVDQIAAALDAAHADGLVHRDVKPGNVLVTDADFAYLADFGIAHTEGDSAVTQVGMAVGSYIYMAPERFDGQATARSDIYSLTCVLHECLTGTTPFPAASMNVLIQSHLNEPPPRPSQRRPGIPPALDAVIAKGMAKAPAERYGSAAELARAARAALSAPATPTFVVRTPDPSRFGHGGEQAPASSLIPPESTGEIPIIRPTAATAVHPTEIQFSPLPTAAPKIPVAPSVPVRPFPDAHLYAEDQRLPDAAQPAPATQRYEASPSLSGPYPAPSSTPFAEVAPPTPDYRGGYSEATGRPESAGYAGYAEAAGRAESPGYAESAGYPESAGRDESAGYAEAGYAEGGYPDVGGYTEPEPPAPVVPQQAPPTRRYPDPEVDPALLTQRFEPVAAPLDAYAARVSDYDAQAYAAETQRYDQSAQPAAGYADPDYSEQGYAQQAYSDRAYANQAYAEQGNRAYSEQGYADRAYSDGAYAAGRGAHPDDPYRDGRYPEGQHPGGYGEPGYGEPGYGDAEYGGAQAYSDYRPDPGRGYDSSGPQADYGYDEQGAYGEAPPEKRRSVVGPILVAVLVIVVVAVGGVVGWTMLRPGADNQQVEEQAGPVTTASPQAAAPGPATTSAPRGTSAAATTTALPAGAKPCATGRPSPGTFGQAAAGSEVTSCPFAEAVRKAYADAASTAANRPPRSVVAVSPVTGRSYTMNCAVEQQVVTCSGGENAVVYIY